MNLRPPSVPVSTHTSSLTPSLSSPSLCQTPGCRSGRNRSTLSPSHPVLSVLHPQGFHDSLRQPPAAHSEEASPPSKVFSFATSSQCSHNGLSQGHGCTKSSDGLVSSCAVPRWYEARLGGVRCGVWRSVPGEGSTYCIHTRGPRLPRPWPFESWGRARLSVGRRAPVGTAWRASSMRGSVWRFQWTCPVLRSRRPLGKWRIAPVCTFARPLRLPPSSAVCAIEQCLWSLSSSPTRLTRRLGKPLRWLP